MIGMLVGLCLAGYAALTPDLEFRKPLFYFSVVIMITDLVIFPYFLLRAGFRRVNYELTYVLTDADLTRKRVGWPDIRIGRSDIKALREGQEWLVVASNDPQSLKIAILRKVDGYDALRAELAKHAPFEKPERGKVSLGFLTLPVSFGCWWLVISSQKTAVVLAAGMLASLLLTWSSFHLYRMFRHSPKRSRLWIFLGLGWITALIFIAIRIQRGFPN